MKKPREPKPWFLLAAIAGLVSGILLRGSPADPDQAFRAAQLLGTFLLFAFWALCCLAWGSALCRLARIRVPGLFGPAALGSAWAALAAGALGHLGLIGYAHLPISLIVLLAGPVLDWGLAGRAAKLEAGLSADPGLGAEASGVREGLSPSRLLAILISASAALVLALRLQQATLLGGQSDPLLYHLTGPRSWTDAGRVAFDPGMPILFNCWYWEYLLVWGQQLLGDEGGRGLIEGQLFGQLAHVAFGGGGSLLAIRRLLRATVPALRKDPAWLALACLAPLASNEVASYLVLAKNDWGAAFWLLSAMALLLEGARAEEASRGRSELAAGGALLGLALLSKLNSLFVALPFLAVALAGLARERGAGGALRAAMLAGGACALVALPMLARNLLATGNPLFPFATALFSRATEAVVGPTTLVYWHASEGAFEPVPRRWLGTLLLVLRDNRLNWLAPVALAAALVRRARRAKRQPVGTDASLDTWGLGALWAAAAAGVAWYCLTRFQLSFLRWVGPPLLLLAPLGLAGIRQALDGDSPWLGRARWLLLGALAAMALKAAARAGTTSGFLPPPLPHELQIRYEPVHRGGDAKAWLRMNARGGEPVLTTGDDQLYYVSHLAVRPVTLDPELDRAVHGMSDAGELIRKLRTTGARFLLDSHHWNSRFWSGSAIVIHLFARECPQALAFAGASSVVYDLDRLEACRAQATPAYSGPSWAELLR